MITTDILFYPPLSPSLLLLLPLLPLLFVPFNARMELLGEDRKPNFRGVVFCKKHAGSSDIRQRRDNSVNKSISSGCDVIVTQPTTTAGRKTPVENSQLSTFSTTNKI